MGLVLAVVVHPADVQDRDGARLALMRLVGRFPRLERIWADGAYAGKLVLWAKNVGGLTLELVRRPAYQNTFEVIPRRWVVERTFAWLGRYRRLSKDYEELPQTTEAWIYAAMTGLMLRRLAHSNAFWTPSNCSMSMSVHGRIDIDDQRAVEGTGVERRDRRGGHSAADGRADGSERAPCVATAGSVQRGGSRCYGSREQGQEAVDDHVS